MDYLDKNDMFHIFLEESLDSLNELSNFLLDLEKNKEDEEAIKNIFRSAHTLKGNSSTIYNTFFDGDEEEADVRLKHTKKLSEVTHALENLIMEARDNNMPLTNEHIDLLFETEQVLESLLSFIESETDEDIDTNPIREKLLKAVESPSESFIETQEKEEKEEDIDKEIGVTFRLDTNLEDDFIYASLSIIYSSIKDKYPEVSFSPNDKEVEEGKPFNDVFVTLHSSEPINSIISFIESVDYVEKAHVVEDNRQHSQTNDILSQILEELEEEHTTENKENQAVDSILDEILKDSPKTEVQQTKRVLTNTSLRVPINRIDEVLKHVSSLVILRNKLLNITKKVTDKTLFDVAEEMSQSIDFLQESVMNIRMTPLDQLFGRFPKDVRNIAKEYNKTINFETLGGETEIDKSLLDELGKPLTHLIRNSIFHGIESEEERIAVGKNPVGLLRLSAKHEQNMVVLTIEDDGAGINSEAVKKKAIEKGLLTPEKADKATKDEIINLIFHPGLSTADKVNNVAGRGVGMDAVRAVVEDMKGHIEVVSIEGKGTKTIINLPLTLAIIPAMLTKIENKFFSIPISQVIEVVEVSAKDIRYVANKEVYILRNKEIPIIRLKEFFNLSHVRDENESLKIVVLKSGNKTIGATVDEFVELEDIVVKNIGDYLGNIRGISGCNILGDGSISLIVDVNNITNSSKSKEK